MARPKAPESFDCPYGDGHHVTGHGHTWKGIRMCRPHADKSRRIWNKLYPRPDFNWLFNSTVTAWGQTMVNNMLRLSPIIATMKDETKFPITWDPDAKPKAR